MISQTIGRGLYAGRVYPSGDFTIGQVNKPPVAKRDEETHPLAGIREDSYFHDGEKHKIYDYDDRQPHLGSSDATNPHRITKARARQGLTGVTPFGKRMLRSGAAVLAKMIPRRLMTFATVTTPAISEDENVTVNANFSELVRQLLQHISRDLVRSGIAPKITYAVEIQEKRYYDTGIVALHLHLVFQGRKSFKHDYAITPARIDRIWQRLLENCLGRPVDTSAANKLETPRTSLEKEIGKYISKGGTVLTAIIKAGLEHLLPSSWWGMETSLRKQVMAAIVILSGEAASYCWDNINDLPIKYRAICLGAEYGNKLVAKVGWITDKNFIDEIRLLS